MKPPVEHVRVSAKGRDILIKVKRNTGLEHWNEICRIALCRSLANPNPLPKWTKVPDSNIDIEWKTFAGQFQKELAALTIMRAKKDGIDFSKKEIVADFFRNHIERGIQSMQQIKNLLDLYKL
ncbi:MAG: DNA sulfur modification protein DndE [Thermodesulfobacteriota bacterium]